MSSKRIQSIDYPSDITLDCLFDDRHVVIFLIDGCRADLLYRMADGGELPAIRRYWIDRGVRVEPAVAPIPPVTNAAVSAMTCGTYPGRLNIIGNRWFDRDQLMRHSVFALKDYYTTNRALKGATVFEMLNDEPTVAIATRTSRGATYEIPIYYNLVGMKDYLMGRWLGVDRVFIRQMADVGEIANREGIFPAVTFVHLPGLDSVEHHEGPFSARARGALKNIDRALGEFAQALERNGALESVCLVIVADHGQVPLEEKNYILWEEYFREGLRLPALDEYRKADFNSSQRRREGYYNRYAVIVANNGRNSSLYVRHNPQAAWVAPGRMAPWPARPSWDEIRHYQTPGGPVDLVGRLRNLAGVRLVIGMPQPGEIAVFSARGEGVIRTRREGDATGYLYEARAGEDPLEYRDVPAVAKLMDGTYHGSREWLDATAGLPMPDIVAQLPSLFESPCAGDLFVVAADRWDFEKVNISSHGGFLRGEMTVPLIMAGPGIRHGRIGPARMVDLVPTILDYLGHGDRIAKYHLDGVSFLPAIAQDGDILK
ncbi:MAG: alkaline phosphatase family protein [Candidatus Aureabacteria bacterium]|nr:alkaline phosphatase family protein [Candidatus Auribacterota bacterium]